LLAGTSLFICLLVTLTVLPALLRFIPVQVESESPSTHPVLATLAKQLATLTLHYAKPISIVTCLLAVIAVGLVFKVKTDFNPINLRDPNTESVIAFKNLIKDPDTTPMTLTVLTTDKQKAEAMQKKLLGLASVDKTVSLFDFVPSGQEEKLAMIEDMAMVLGSQAQGFPALKPDNDPTPAINRLIKTIDNSLPGKTDSHEIAALNAFKKELQDMLI
jgi:hypothetical protein